MLVINCKNYAEASGRALASIVRAADAAAARHRITVAVAPPTHLVSSVRPRRALLFAQHVDDASPGSTTGHIAPELLRAAGVAGSLVNHSEHRLRRELIGATIARLRRLRMTSIVCARTAAETAALARLRPDYVAIEPPSLIGSGTAISQARPSLVRAAAAAVRGRRAELLCGAGIVSGEDVARAAELGSRGVLVASGIVRARSPARVISEFAARLAAARRA